MRSRAGTSSLGRRARNIPCRRVLRSAGPRPRLPNSSRGRRNPLSVRYRLRHCNGIGDAIVLDGDPYIHNLGHIAIGDGVEIRSLPVVSHLVTGPRGRIEIVRGARIAHGAAVAAHQEGTIGEGVSIGPFVTIMDTDFHRAGDADGAAETGPVHIGENCRLGSRVSVLRGSRIGAGAVVAAGSVVSGAIRPGARVTGVPARIQNGRSDHESMAMSVDNVAIIIARTFGLGE